MLGPQEAIVIIASPETNPDLFWATKFWTPDPIILVQTQKETFVLVGELEFARAHKQILDAHVVLERDYYTRFWESRRTNTSKVSPQALALDILLDELGVVEVRIQGRQFPYSYAEDLKSLGYHIKPIFSSLFLDKRSIKTAEELNYIQEVSLRTDEAIGQAIEVLREAKIKTSGFLYIGDTLVTSEMLKEIMTVYLWKHNCLGAHTILSSGIQSYEPHNEGSGPIKAHTPIVMDVFPRSMINGYFTDTTRTVCKGKASKKLSAMFNAVLTAQQNAINILKSGLPAKETNVVAVTQLERAGFKTSTVKGVPQGFIHGLGHGVGVEIHEAPSLNGSSYDIIEKNNVITVEPGLYYPHIGGVRIEDTLVITEDGYRSLTNSPKEQLEIS